MRETTRVCILHRTTTSPCLPESGQLYVVKKVLESSLAIPNADLDILIAESMTFLVRMGEGSGKEKENLGGGGFEGEFVA